MRFRLLIVLGVLVVCAATAYAHYPSCNYSGAYCIYGHVYDQTQQFWPVSLCTNGFSCKGPVDLCYDWDSTCSAPLYTVCQLHSDNPDKGAFYFTLPVSGGWLTKVRTPWAQRYQYAPYTRSYPADTVAEGTVLLGADTDFSLINGSPYSQSSC